MKGICPYCKEPIHDNFEKHLEENHFMSIQSYYESGEILLKGTENCLKCGTPRSPLSTILGANNYYLPCWRCLGEGKYEKPQAIETVQRAIKDYYSSIEGDRYLQMYLSDPIFERETLPHGYGEFKNVLKILQNTFDIDRNKLWIPDFNPGYPRTISTKNINGLKIVDIEKEFKIKEVGRHLIVNGVKITPAETIPYDQRHFSRYNILNVNNPDTDYRNTKRIRLGDKAIKFYNNKRSGIKSIFLSSEQVDSLPSGVLLVIKLLILRNKSNFRLISSIINELIKSIGTFRDSIFLRNTIQINPDNPLRVNLMWLPEKRLEGYINISIL